MTDIIIELDRRPFVYREVLGIPKKVNFGLELELDKIDPDMVYKLVRKEFGSSWIVKEDKSLTKGENAEIVSPVLHNTKDTWILLKKMGELLERLNPNYDKCSFQVNFDGSILPRVEDKVRFLKLYAMYEDIVYRLSQGDRGSYRDSMEEYAAPIILYLKGGLSISNEASINLLSNQKRYGIAFKDKDSKDLIEFRSPNMSSNPIEWQNYINVFYYMLMVASKPKYDKGEVDRYVDHYYKCYIIEDYEREKREKAIQFAKVILPGNTDKSNFFHQYMRNVK